jgi:dCTP deaminase
MLSDCDLRSVLEIGELKISPAVGEANIQPASIDLRLDKTFRMYPAPNEMFGAYTDPLDRPSEGDTMLTYPVTPGGQFPLPPHGFALASTIEEITVGRTLVGILAGKSSLARCGLAVEAAGWIDPGFTGTVTLELSNLTDRYLMLTPGMLIAQLAVARLDTPCARPYGHPMLRSKYQGQLGPTPSRAFAHKTPSPRS